MKGIPLLKFFHPAKAECFTVLAGRISPEEWNVLHALFQSAGLQRMLSGYKQVCAELLIQK